MSNKGKRAKLGALHILDAEAAPAYVRRWTCESCDETFAAQCLLKKCPVCKQLDTVVQTRR